MNPTTTSSIANPYLDAWFGFGLDKRDRFGFPANIEREIDAWTARRSLVLEYAWAIPDDEALAALVDLSPIVEVGAGGGYWTSLLRALGADVAAYDLAPGGAASRTEAIGERRRVWADVQRAGAKVSARHPDRTLFLCWPPYSSDMAYASLRAYLNAGGTTLAYIGEGEGGCTASDPFFALRDKRMDEAGTIYIPQWPGVHDYLSIWRVADV